MLPASRQPYKVDPVGISNARLEEALRKNAGVKAAAAQALGTTRQNVQQRVDRSAHLQAVLREIDEGLLDLAEGAVIKSINKGDSRTARWLLEMKGKSRGYINKVETSFDEGTIEAIVGALRGDLGSLRAARDRLAEEVAPERQAKAARPDQP